MKHSEIERGPSVLRFPSGELKLDRVLVMGILNVTPDSFYDGGRYRKLDHAVVRALEMVDEGASIIDVGGEKAGPGDPVSSDEEIRRIVPVIETLRSQMPLPISADTFKPEVARAAIRAGADIINSIGGFGDPAMRRVAAESGAACVVMHIKGVPRVANPHPRYDDVGRDVAQAIDRRVEACLADGIAPDRIVTDPGPDFGKTTAQSIAVLRDLKRLTRKPYPVLLAVSRKKFIGDVLGVDVHNRLEGSLAVAAWGVMQGVKIIRTHDVRATSRVVLMTEAVYNPGLVSS